MTTRTVKADHQWQKITDGTQTVMVQIMGATDICDSPAEPGADQPAHSFSNTVLTITPPTVLWARASWYEGNVRLIVS